MASVPAVASQMRRTQRLRDAAGDAWDRIVHHRFVDELAAGTISRDVLRRYLLQDHRFLDAFVVLLASMVAAAPSLADRIPGCRFLALITGEENTYFERSFDALGVTQEERAATANKPVTTAFQQLMRDAAATGDLAEMLAVLVGAEWSYQCWGERVAPTAVREPFWCREWVDLHSGEYFGSVVDYLRGLLDNLPLTEAREAAVLSRFLMAVELEARFFDAAYEDE